jgi:hypothetical protein
MDNPTLIGGFSVISFSSFSAILLVVIIVGIYYFTQTPETSPSASTTTSPPDTSNSNTSGSGGSNSTASNTSGNVNIDNSFKKYLNQDSGGYDYDTTMIGKSLQELANKCNADSKCIAFNSGGWLKNQLNPSGLATSGNTLYIKNAYAIENTSVNSGDNSTPLIIRYEYAPDLCLKINTTDGSVSLATYDPLKKTDFQVYLDKDNRIFKGDWVLDYTSASKKPEVGVTIKATKSKSSSALPSQLYTIDTSADTGIQIKLKQLEGDIDKTTYIIRSSDDYPTNGSRLILDKEYSTDTRQRFLINRKLGNYRQFQLQSKGNTDYWAGIGAPNVINNEKLRIYKWDNDDKTIRMFFDNTGRVNTLKFDNRINTPKFDDQSVTGYSVYILNKDLIFKQRGIRQDIEIPSFRTQEWGNGTNIWYGSACSSNYYNKWDCSWLLTYDRAIEVPRYDYNNNNELGLWVKKNPGTEAEWPGQNNQIWKLNVDNSKLIYDVVPNNLILGDIPNNTNSGDASASQIYNSRGGGDVVNSPDVIPTFNAFGALGLKR